VKLLKGNPGQFLGDLPETTQETVETYTKLFYSRFQPLSNEN